MFREKFSELCEHLRPFVSDGTNYPNNRSLSVGKKITCCLHYLKDTEFFLDDSQHIWNSSVNHFKANCESMPGSHI